MSQSNPADQTAPWRRLSVDDVRGAPVAPAADIAAATLNPEAEAVAQALRHRRLDPAGILHTIRAADAAGFWMAGFAMQVIVRPLDAVGTERMAIWALAMAAAMVTGLWLARGYRLRVLRRFGEAWLRGAVIAAALGLVLILLRPWGDETLHVATGFVAAHLTALVLLRLPVSAFADWCIEARVTERRAAIVGGGGNAERLIRGLEAQPDNDIRIVAMFDDRGNDRSPPLVAGCRKLGTIAELVAFARIAELDMLIVTLPLSAEQRILSLLKALWVLPVDIRLSAYSNDYAFPRRSGEVHGLIGVIDNPLRGAGVAMKRMLDVIVASAALIALSPVMLLTALAIRLDSPGPVLFVQQRHGFNHRPVDVWKFRSMYHGDADPDARRIVTKDDPRVTRVGRFIRKASIDELPQLFNVLMGELSLVGPRPHAVNARSSRQQMFTEIVEGYSGRHRVPPGITGWAQINGWRGEVDDPEKLRRRFECDLYYIENWSLWLDLKILLRTPLSLFDTRHAY
jgi:Undecaprenyl-phosphate glucose phosphotransferase